MFTPLELATVWASSAHSGAELAPAVLGRGVAPGEALSGVVGRTREARPPGAFVACWPNPLRPVVSTIQIITPSLLCQGLSLLLCENNGVTVLSELDHECNRKAPNAG